MSRLKKIGIVLGYGLLLMAIVVVICYAHIGARDHRESQRVTGFDIHIDGDGSHMLIDTESMYRWFSKHDVSPKGKSIAELDLAELERVALKHSAIESCNAYITYDGRIDMTIMQREPVARLRLDGGYDHYVATDGVLFRASDGYAAYVPVITGSYKLIVDRDFSGNVLQYIADSVTALERRIVELEHKKYPILSDRKRIKARNKSVQDSTIKKPFWVSKDTHKSRIENLKLFKEAHNQKYLKEDAEYAKQLDKLITMQERLKQSIATLESTNADIERLIVFIKGTLADSFWSAEITQLVLTSGDKGAIHIAIVPRSGDYLVDLGDTHNLVEKLQNTRKFYDKVLRNVGWDKYRRISVRYDGQVVCLPRN